MSYISRRTKIVITFLFLVVAGYAFVRFLGAKDQIPKNFTDARSKGSAIAANIVALSNQSRDDLAKVNQYDKDSDYTDALTLTTSIVAQSQQIRDQALALDDQVSEMTKALPSISSPDAQQAALDSISSRLALVSQLINYSDDLNALLNVLRDKFTGKIPQDSQVQTLVDKINTDVAAVNNFNAQAGQSMTQFDTIVAKK